MTLITFGNRLFRRTINACKTVFENRGPIGTYSEDKKSIFKCRKGKTEFRDFCCLDNSLLK